MSDVKLGKIIEGEAYRDAIHVAVAPVVAACRLRPGQHVGLMPNGHASDKAKQVIGIVDPFLDKPVMAGEKFWMCLYQQTVTGMRHHWAHPAFEEPVDEVDDFMVRNTDKMAKTRARVWIADYANRLGLEFEELMAGAIAFVDHGGYLCKGGTLEGMSTDPEFWMHFNDLTGKKGKGSFFTCSC